VCRVTVVGSRRRLDVTLPEEIPVAELIGDIADMLAEADEEIPAGWSLTRVGGRALDPERSLSEQGVTSGTMLFLRDVAAPVPPAEIDDFGERVAVAVDAQRGRWSRWTAEILLVCGAGMCLLAAALAVLLAGDRGVRTLVGLMGAATAIVAGGAIVRVLRRGDFGAVITLSGVPLWAAAAAGIAGFAGADQTGILAAALGGASAGAGAAVVVVGGRAVVPAAGVIAATLVPALVAGGADAFGARIDAAAALLVPLALGAVSLAPSIAVRVAGVDLPGARPLDPRVGQGRGLLASLLVGLAAVLVAASVVVVARGGWFAWALVAAGAIASVVKARHFRFAAEVGPLLVAGLVGLLLLQYPLAVQLPGHGWDGAGIVLVVDAVVVLAAGAWVRRWNPTPQLLRRLGSIDALATAATVPLSLGVLGTYEAVERFARGLG
jgi:type VII secretion integral membrane protein EccD